MDGQKLWVANVGDSRAVLSRKGQAVQMSTDHEPNTERGSIEDRGGFVSNMPGKMTLAFHTFFQFFFDHSLLNWCTLVDWQDGFGC